ncbi:MAG: prephenate dehydrogenase [Elusimicrobia bacterium]|nr:prephenate dehydrogenase [Candidatus Liberimonas magnetica]
MKKIAIIGVGLIGGSLGMALKSREKPAYKITGIGRRLDRLRLAKKLGAVDNYTLDWQEGLKRADIVIVSTPVDLIAQTVKKIIPYLKESAIISDVGSVKGPVIKEVNKVLSEARKKYKRSIPFVGAHPMAGSEKTGVQFADKKIYNGATVVLVKDASTKKIAVNKIGKIWKAAGANVIITDPFMHDRIVSLISHLPHVIAFSLCLMAKKLNKKDRKTSKFLAGSFKDLTRIANSNPRDWACICKQNKKELNISIADLVKLLLKIKSSLNSCKRTEKTFLEAKLARQKLLNI